MQSETKYKLFRVLWLLPFYFGCNPTEKSDDNYKFMYGKWKCESHDEVWIDKNYIFMGCPDFPILYKYKIEGDSIACYLFNSESVFEKLSIPKQLGSDTICLFFGGNKSRKYYRVRQDLPKIDTTNTWEKEALLEIVNYSYARKGK